MSDTSAELTDIYIRRYEELLDLDERKKGFFYHNSMKCWIFYRYDDCLHFLNGVNVTKKRMNVPLDLFQIEDRHIVQHFLHIFNESVIFNDKKHSGVASVISSNYRKMDVCNLINSVMGCIGENSIISEKDIGRANNILACFLTGIPSDDELTRHAIKAGMLFDGKISDANHFVSVVKSFIFLYDKFTALNEYATEVNDTSVDLTVAFIAAHQTSMHLIFSVLYDISNMQDGESVTKQMVLESARLHSPVISVGRIFLMHEQYKGQDFNAGEKALFYTGFANYDPETFVNPLTFIPGRKARPLSFGTGLNTCIGMNVSIDFVTSFVNQLTKKYRISKLVINEVSEGSAAIGVDKFNVNLVKR
ncbi:cytochrome P450 [Enterobacteriaceae bacterium H11S18]|uniref:cytochrome P450 n=1 Tax=Dryocola clanedunensis TaxID=2925396 RepID=UPI0022F04E66|nr:cytochrome P450 [Dryocola clanedunensis]MCT4708837.1 cytochrome P450 [Dryocola clanedunensis]